MKERTVNRGCESACESSPQNSRRISPPRAPSTPRPKRLSTDSADYTDSRAGRSGRIYCRTGAAAAKRYPDVEEGFRPLDRLPPPPLVIRQSTIGSSSCGSSPRNSASWLRSSLRRDPGRNLNGNVDCDSARTSGRNLTRCSARNLTRSSSRCSRGSGTSSGGNSRTSSPPRSSGDSSGRDLGSYVGSYGVGIGGVGKGIGASVLGLGKLGPFS